MRFSRLTNTVRLSPHNQPITGTSDNSCLATKAVPLAPAMLRMSTQLIWFEMKKTSRRNGVPTILTRAPTIHAVKRKKSMGKGDP